MNDIQSIISKLKYLLHSGVAINEECTKLYLILPFLSYLGYDISSPQEIVYEYECDMHEKGSRRVDCVILDKDGWPLILVEAKALKEDLSAHWGQAKSYLVSSSAKYVILTDGNTYSVFGRTQINSDFLSAPPLYTFVVSNLVPDDFEIIRMLARINAKLPITTPLYSPEILVVNEEVPQKEERIISERNPLSVSDFIATNPKIIGRAISAVYEDYLSFMKNAETKPLSEYSFERQIISELRIQRLKQSGKGYFIDEHTISDLFEEFIDTKGIDSIIGTSISSLYDEYQSFSHTNGTLMFTISKFEKYISDITGAQILQSFGEKYLVKPDTPLAILKSFVDLVTLEDIINHPCTEIYQQYHSFCQRNNRYALSNNRFCSELIAAYTEIKISSKSINGLQISYFVQKNNPSATEEGTTAQSETVRIIRKNSSSITEEENMIESEITRKVKIVEKYLSRLLPEKWESFDLPTRRNWLKSDEIGTIQRKTVCNMEIWAEALFENPDEMDRYTTSELRNIMKLIPNWKRNKTGTRTMSFYGQQRYYVRIK